MCGRRGTGVSSSVVELRSVSVACWPAPPVSAVFLSLATSGCAVQTGVGAYDRDAISSRLKSICFVSRSAGERVGYL